MPLLSAFTPFGMLDFSSEPSEGERIYDAMVAAYTDSRDGRQAIAICPGTWQEAKVYATAMAIAAARLTLRGAGNELRGETSYALLEAHEWKYSLAPSPTDTVPQRRAALAAKQKLARGPRREAVEEALRAILGDNLIKYRPITVEEAATFDPSTGPGVFGRADTVDRVVRCKAPIAGPPGASFEATVPYENWDVSEPEVVLRKDDRLCVQPENFGLAERVTVTSVAGTGPDRTFTATFTKSHDENCSATAGLLPLWTSTKRFVLIVVASVAALDAETVRRIDELMARVSRACTWWAVVQPSSAGAATAGPFILNVSPLGAVPVGTVTI